MHSNKILLSISAAAINAVILFSCASLPEEISDRGIFEKEITVKSGIEKKDVKNISVKFFLTEHFIFDESGHELFYNLQHNAYYDYKRQSKYDDAGNQIYYSDGSLTWEKKYNDRNALIYYSDSQEKMNEWDDAGNEIHYKERDFEYTSEFDASNNEIKRTYNDGDVSTFEYDEKNRLIRETITGGMNMDEYYEYNDNSDETHYVCYDYDEFSIEETWTTYLAKQKPLLEKTEYRYYTDETFKQIDYVDSSSTTYEYDKSQRLIHSYYDSDWTKSRDQRFEYDKDGLCSTYINGELTDIKDKNGTLRYQRHSNGSQIWYDEKGRLIKTDGKEHDPNIYCEYEYDKNGNCIKKIYETLTKEYVYDKKNVLLKEAGYSDGELLNCTEYEYKYDSNGYCTYKKETRTEGNSDRIFITEYFYINEYSYYSRKQIKECFRYESMKHNYYIEGNTFHEQSWW
ncbi:MAG: RHS repeat protein [Treponema sp.]|nr:RHS repeat protein [Treponema sp.]